MVVSMRSNLHNDIIAVTGFDRHSLPAIGNPTAVDRVVRLDHKMDTGHIERHKLIQRSVPV